MKFWQSLALLICLLMIICISWEKDKIVLIILVCIDDIVVATLGSMYIVSFKTVLSNNFDITNSGKLKFMLGILVTYNCTNWLIFLSQSVYIYQVLNHFGMQDATPVSTFLAVKHNLSVCQSPTLEAEKYAYKEYVDNIHYFSLVGSLLFMTQTQSNI